MRKLLLGLWLLVLPMSVLAQASPAGTWTTIDSATLRAVASGKPLEAPGLMGFSLLGRTQVWLRK